VTADRQGSRLPGRTALRVRYLDNTGSGVITRTGFPSLPRVRLRVADDVARDIVDILDARLQFDDSDGPRPLQPSDIAVLVRKRDQATLIQEALTRANVPSVLTGSSSVFTTPAATAWGQLLAALEQPNRAGRLRLAALGPLVGLTATALSCGGDDLLATLSTEMRSWAKTFADFGLASAFEVIAAAHRLDTRLLRTEGGERMLTDLRHLAQLLDRAATTERLGLTSLGRWLARRIEDATVVTEADRGRLLDRESAAVRVVTIHSSKGLEFPVVYLPFAWDAVKPNTSDALLLHEDGRRVRDVGGEDGPGHADRQAQAAIEDAGEELRLFYVGATRARSHVVAWWAPSVNTAASPLHRLVFGRPGRREQPDAAPDIPADRDLAAAFAAWASSHDDVISIEAVPANEPPRRWTPQADPRELLAVASFDRTLNWLWRRNSFTRLTETSHQSNAGSLSETDESSTVDEPEDSDRVVATATGLAGRTPSLMNDMPAGTAFGTLVHSILQDVDTSAANLAAEVRARTADRAAKGFTSVDVEALATALTAVLITPTPHGPLADVAPRERLTELEFELPLAGGDDTIGTGATLAAIADLIGALLPPDDPLAGYPATLRTLPGATLRGYLTGSLDVVLRVDGPVYVVVDYKTNKLFAGAVDAEQFDQAAMADEMVRKHYPLQALLYSVALHRYLRWRQTDYDPERHLGGVMYLFVRAMVGQATPPACGVFSWRPPTALVVGLSDLLAGKPPQ
jgi:exodeoxyribonuclease V beta subunit